MDGESIAFPAGAAVCAPGDFLLCAENDGDWRVYRVEDLVTLRRLLPVLDHPSALMVEGDLLDSVAPAYHRGVYLLVTAFEPGFPDEAAANTAVERQALTESARGLLREAGEFPRTRCRVVRRPDLQ